MLSSRVGGKKTPNLLRTCVLRLDRREKCPFRDMGIVLAMEPQKLGGEERGLHEITLDNY